MMIAVDENTLWLHLSAVRMIRYRIISVKTIEPAGTFLLLGAFSALNANDSLLTPGYPLCMAGLPQMNCSLRCRYLVDDFWF
jgi:hypothetical protein